MIDLIQSDTPGQTVIQCPKCGSPDWYCWDERVLDCWDREGHQAGVKVVGYLGCNVCRTVWTDVSIAPDPDCDCECEEE